MVQKITIQTLQASFVPKPLAENQINGRKRGFVKCQVHGYMQ